MRGLSEGLPSDRRDPTLEIVVRRDACDLPLALLEDRGSGNPVLLPGGGGQVAVGLEVLAFNNELGSPRIAADHKYQIPNPLAVAVIHVRLEAPERLGPNFASPFVHVVHHVFCHQCDHPLGVVAVERLEVFAH